MRQKNGISRSGRFGTTALSAKIPNAVLAGKTWQIPEDAEKPKRTNAKTENALLSVFREEKKQQRKGGIYHKLAAVDLTNQPPQACDFSHELGGFSLDL